LIWLISFRGSAPIHHTLLAGHTTTGVTVQTLHPKKFDHGLILSQTPAPGLEIPNPESCTVPDLENFLAQKGAQMLVETIEKGLFVPPVSVSSIEQIGEASHAPKITPEDRHIDWTNWTLTEIKRRNRVIGPLWSKALCSSNPADGPLKFQRKRVIFTDTEEVDPPKGCDSFSVLPGLPFTNASHPVEPKKTRQLYVFTVDGKVLRINRMKVEGEQDAEGLRAAIKARMFGDRAFHYEGRDLTPFRNPLV
jgi:methionyl-tRNA formyltransferase